MNKFDSMICNLYYKIIFYSVVKNSLLIFFFKLVSDIIINGLKFFVKSFVVENLIMKIKNKFFVKLTREKYIFLLI